MQFNQGKEMASLPFSCLDSIVFTRIDIAIDILEGILLMGEFCPKNNNSP